MTHQPALDGVRGIAILLVLTTNLAWGFPRGGYLGVDIFFVLSGLLITSLLLAEHSAAGGVSVWRFLARRALRLLPALAALLGALLLYAFLFADSAVQRATLIGAGYSFFYVGNWYMALGGEEAVALMGPLAHTWSLSVEEQFYLVWPLALVALLRLRLRGRALAVALLGAAALVGLWRAYLHATDPTWTRLYFGTDTRADGLFVGCALGVLLHQGAIARLPLQASRALALLGAVLLGALILTMTSNDPVMYGRGGYTIAGLGAGGVIVHLLRHPEGWLSRAISARWLRGVGVVSYGLYLWHLPIAIVLRPDASASLGARLGAELARLLVIGAVTAGSYFAIERPFLRLKARLQRPRSVQS